MMHSYGVMAENALTVNSRWSQSSVVAQWSFLLLFVRAVEQSTDRGGYE